MAPTKDRVQVEYQIAAYFKLNTDRLRDFHEQLGLRYKAYTSSGWDNLIRNTFRQQIENALQQETRRYDVADIYGNDELLTTLQTDVQTTLSERLEAALGEQYFCGPTFKPGGECTEITFVIKKIDLPKSVIAAFEAKRNSQIAVDDSPTGSARHRGTERRARQGRRELRAAQGDRVGQDQLLGPAVGQRAHAPSPRKRDRPTAPTAPPAPSGGGG